MTGTHNIRFAEAQASYLETREKRHLDRMYRICADLAEKYIAKYARRRDLDIDIAELAHDGAASLIALYIRKPEFRLEIMCGYLYRCCNTAMWRDKTWNKKTVSLEPMVEMELI
jgi:hypothetical protein